MNQTGVKEKETALYRDVMKGLTNEQKYLPSKYFYDVRGSELFEQICELDEYYPTDCEMEIMRRDIDGITDMIGDHVQLIELGSGSSLKTRQLLDHLDSVDMYVPVDISEDFLNGVTEQLRKEYTDIPIRPVAADYTIRFEIPASETTKKRVVYFPGSTIGNFDRKPASAFLNNIGKNLSTDDGLLIGVDLKKEIEVLEAAYNDSKGITSAFNKNILARLNRELGANFDVDQFKHWAFYNRKQGRIEMHLESLSDQQVSLNGQQIIFEQGETIHTENSHKYRIEEFEEIAGSMFQRQKTWTDSREYFSVHYFKRV